MYKIYQVDAFADALFAGNPAAVVPLESWLADDLMQRIAGENNLSETAFFVPLEVGYQLRWFTPEMEVDLCGHATLATAHVLFSHLDFAGQQLTFSTRSGPLHVVRSDAGYRMDFPADRGREVAVPEVLVKALGVLPLEVLRGKDDYLAVFPEEGVISKLEPDFRAMLELDGRGLVATAPGTAVDFVSRCFFPKAGVDEDPVTGSAHTLMTPYWAEKLGRSALTARQLSRRGGRVACSLEGDRVFLEGQAVTFLEGQFRI